MLCTSTGAANSRLWQAHQRHSPATSCFTSAIAPESPHSGAYTMHKGRGNAINVIKVC
jgi:hypothetical protein